MAQDWVLLARFEHARDLFSKPNLIYATSDQPLVIGTIAPSNRSLVRTKHFSIKAFHECSILGVYRDGAN
jgi:hypothetical protein